MADKGHLVLAREARCRSRSFSPAFTCEAPELFQRVAIRGEEVIPTFQRRRAPPGEHSTVCPTLWPSACYSINRPWARWHWVQDVPEDR
jgi:hypothetical protein